MLDADCGKTLEIRKGNLLKFFTYEYLRDDWTPYYVGKGFGKRHRRPHRVSIPKDDAHIRIQYWADEATAFEMERFFIRLWGRKDNGTGILWNLTAGGQGSTGYKHTEETLYKIAKAAGGNKNCTGRKLSNEHCHKLHDGNRGNKYALGHKHSEEARRKISEAHRGRKLSEEHKRVIGDANRGRVMTEVTRRKISETEKITKQRRITC